MSSNTSSATRTNSTSTTISASDVRYVISQVTREVLTIRSAASDIPCNVDIGDALSDCAILALNDVIACISLQFFVDDEEILVREYRYSFQDGDVSTSGPAADNPPLARNFPPNTRLRLVVSENESQDSRVRDFWFSKLGWSSASDLTVPDNTRVEVFGFYASGGYGVERRLLVNPRFDIAPSQRSKGR